MNVMKELVMENKILFETQRFQQLTYAARYNHLNNDLLPQKACQI